MTCAVLSGMRRVSTRSNGSGKPKPLASPYGRSWLWALLVLTLCVWTALKGYATPQLALSFVGVILAAATQHLTEELRRAKALRIREALRYSDIGISKAAGYLYRDGETAEAWERARRRAPDLEKALNGERVLDLWRLERLPLVFHQHYALLELRDRGLPDYARTCVKASLGLSSLPERELA